MGHVKCLFLKGTSSHFLPLLLGPGRHACLQSVYLSHDEASVFPQRIRVLIELHLLPDPRVLLPTTTVTLLGYSLLDRHKNRISPIRPKQIHKLENTGEWGIFKCITVPKRKLLIQINQNKSELTRLIDLWAVLWKEEMILEDLRPRESSWLQTHSMKVFTGSRTFESLISWGYMLV